MRSGSASRRSPWERVARRQTWRESPRHVFDADERSEQRAGRPAAGRHMPTLPIFELLQERRRGLVLARVLAPALRVVPALRVPVVAVRIDRPDGRAGAGRLRRRLVLFLRRQPVLRRGHLVGADQLVAGAPQEQQQRRPLTRLAATLMSIRSAIAVPRPPSRLAAIEIAQTLRRGPRPGRFCARCASCHSGGRGTVPCTL